METQWSREFWRRVKFLVGWWFSGRTVPYNEPLREVFMSLSLDAFRRELIACGLVTPQELEDVVAALPADRPVRTAAELARELVRLRTLTAYQAQEVARGHGQRLLLGNYLILDKIGQGGMGLVLKAEHRRMRRVVALKVLRARALASEAAVRRFHREVQAAARLIHPNIVTAFDADEDRGTHFLVMEYVEGTDLSTLVKLQGPLPLARAVDYVVQAATGLAHAHERGIVHRDIKPRNLLLSREGIVKILDMGLARIETSTPADPGELTGSGQIMGTVDYMAPEQAVHPKDADERADIYSLGATLWYLVTGQHLYEGRTVLEKLIAHREQPIPCLSERVLRAPPPIDAVFQRMVAKKPQQRYASMREVIAALDHCRPYDDTAVTVLLDPPHAAQAKSAAHGFPAAIPASQPACVSRGAAESDFPPSVAAASISPSPGTAPVQSTPSASWPAALANETPAAAEQARSPQPDSSPAPREEAAAAHVLEWEPQGPGWRFLGADSGSHPSAPAAELETLAENPSASDTSRSGGLAFPLIAAIASQASEELRCARRYRTRGPKAPRVWPRGRGWWLAGMTLLVLALVLAAWLWLRGAGTSGVRSRSTAGLILEGTVADVAPLWQQAARPSPLRGA